MTSGITVGSKSKSRLAAAVVIDTACMPMTIRDHLSQAATTITRRDAEVLLGHLLGRDHAWLLGHSEDELPENRVAGLAALVARRAAHEPLQYLTGEQEFFGLPLRVTPATLIPRPETEHLVEAVLAWAQNHTGPLRILDVGTGTGAIAIALAKHLMNAQVTACDLSTAALTVAEENARTHEVSVRFVESDLLAAFAGESFDAVVSNPPYVPIGDAAEMQPEVRDFEPHSALFAGEDGLVIYRRLIIEARAALIPGGLLGMEFGFGQRDALRTLLVDWKSVRFIDDYAGIPRVVLAEK
jgi:release factor glutamine methyltransferase